MFKHEDIDDGPLSSKMHKVCCCHTYCFPCNGLFHPCRKAVSGKKRRTIKEGFNLDLVPITPRIIVHGFPATGIEHIYRNPRYEILRYMEKYHKDHYKVYNFCCEPGRGYSPEVFKGRVERYPFKDHNTPPLETMVAFANSGKAWLDADPANIVTMHCKAGKGRAGLMCCVMLIRAGVVQSAKEALDLYDRERVTNNRGLTVCSQRKFVVFYEALWRKCWGVTGDIGQIPADDLENPVYVVPEQPAFTLYGVDVLNVPAGFVKNYRITVYKVTNFLPELLYDSGFIAGDAPSTTCQCTLKGNFKVYVEFKNSLFAKSVKLFELLHNTYFMDVTEGGYTDFPLDQLDMKKKLKPKLQDIVARLNFKDDKGHLSGTTLKGGKEGYAIVPVNDNQGIEMTNVI